MFEFIFDLFHDLARQWMNFIRNMHEAKFLTTTMLLNIIYYIFPLTIIIVLAIKAKGFSKVR